MDRDLVPDVKIGRRSLLRAGLALPAALLVARAAARLEPVLADEKAAAEIALPPLPYPVDALEPYIDAKTMEIHHGKHHAAYVKNLNGVLAAHKDLAGRSLEDLLRNDAAVVPADVRQSVINNGGGHANHSLFWKVLGPASKEKAAAEPEGPLAEALKSTFGGLDKLKEKMHEAGMKRFGSGWSWLVRSGDGKLDVHSSANQDSPLMHGATPLLGIDVWEHAYYLKYQNRRDEYLKAIWNVVSWREVSARFGPG